MLTLFELMSNPDMNPYHGMRGNFPFLTVFLMVFIIFGSFGMIALLTGVISESMFEKNALRRDSERMEREQKRKDLHLALESIFRQLEIDDDGEAAKDAVNNTVPSIANVLQELGIHFRSDDLEKVIQIM